MSVGVIVGRFQVDNLHQGHHDLIRVVSEKHPTVLLFLGVASVPVTKNNPLDFMTRKLMIQGYYPGVTVLALPDQRSDRAWSAELDRRIKEVSPRGEVVLYGGRDSFIPHYSGRYKTQDIPFNTYEASEVSGTGVREKSGNKVLGSSEFRAGIIYATQNRFPQAMLCVDIAIMDGDNLLLGRKPGEDSWRFIGGHVDPNLDSSIEMAARREVLEETGLEIASLEYVSSARVGDWRLRNEPDKIFTAFYVGQYTFGAAQAADDIAKVQWFPITDLDRDDIVTEHRVLFDKLITYLLELHAKSDSANRLVQADTLEAVPV